jgi:hypothetical protein
VARRYGCPSTLAVQLLVAGWSYWRESHSFRHARLKLGIYLQNKTFRKGWYTGVVTVMFGIPAEIKFSLARRIG